MAHRFEVDRLNKIGRMTYFDEVTGEELAQVGRETPKRLEAFLPKVVIIDFSGVTKVAVSSEVVKTLAHLPGQIPEGLATVIVAPNEFTYGVARMFQILKNDDKLHVVRNLGEAYVALRIENPTFELFEPDEG